ncbi:hypothetical protein HZH68_008811 [Vespula germanica]|uniref:Uncharacterized protein n=1 Tax=Vespula germanica TaxID=30212 RepID=A0A834K327_VESGE|nr:hypothetical protein HZH68_008811 [Vespula germanica]
MQQPPRGGTWVDFYFALTRDSDNLSPRMDSEILAEFTGATINEDLTKIYNSLFDFRHKCEVGILGFERRQQSRLCFELRRVNLEIFTRARDFDNLSPRMDLEIFADAIHANLNAKWGYSASRNDNKVGSLTDLCSSQFSCALDSDEGTWDLEIFALWWDLEIFVFPEDFENLSPGVDLEICAFPKDFEIISS